MSFEIALSGIQSINTQLEAVSNNIANAGTYGFKSSRANFSAMYAGSQATGVEVGSMTQSIGLNGGVTTTGRGLDAAIDGRGFFVSRDSQGIVNYSRVGIFSANKDGYLVDSNGRSVQGYAAVKGSAALGVMGNIVVPTGQIPAVASTKVNYVGNLSNDWVTPAAAFDPANATSYNMAKQSVVYDSLGSQHTLSQYFVKGAGTSMTVHYAVDGATPLTTTTTLTFDAMGQLPPVPPVTTLNITTTNGSAPITLDVNYAGTTEFAGEAITTTNSTDGYASGTFIGVEMGTNGSVMAKYSNEQQQVVGTVAIATFADEGSLTAMSDTSWTASSASGAALYGTPGSGLAGKLNTGALERSNVDITSELVGLMTSQRNYQANSKVISTENQMIQSLMQAL
ncbi:flagellar hook-basal body complex protein [Massilia sp. P8910]|uniref:flagellar hook protein FlgE n=1 Tax=Massilia antarctica TaxID=2765360 RepID=UPI001E32FC33|nr:flagellar hook-basal body complex protein [Massilia antarctica]MCE3606146.1 flagellar hook-basal body complex protein [Massilia antarctica]